MESQSCARRVTMTLRQTPSRRSHRPTPWSHLALVHQLTGRIEWTGRVLPVDSDEVSKLVSNMGMQVTWAKWGQSKINFIQFLWIAVFLYSAASWSTVCFYLRPSVLDSSQQLAGLVVFGTFRPMGGKEVAKRALAISGDGKRLPVPLIFFCTFGHQMVCWSVSLVNFWHTCSLWAGDPVTDMSCRFWWGHSATRTCSTAWLQGEDLVWQKPGYHLGLRQMLRPNPGCPGLSCAALEVDDTSAGVSI